MVIVDVPPLLEINGLTASPMCNILIGATKVIGDDEYSIVAINLLDGDIFQICNPMRLIAAITSMLEFIEPTECGNTLDLDCNDSSSATGADYNSSAVTCLMRQATVADEEDVYKRQSHPILQYGEMDPASICRYYPPDELLHPTLLG